MSSLAETPELRAFARFIDLTIEKRQLNARLKDIEETLKAMQPALLAHLSASGLKSLHLNHHLVSPHREPWIYPMTGVSRQRVCEALKIAGLGRYVQENYNTMSLTAYVKQLEERAKLITGLEEGKSDDALRQLLHPALAEILHVKAAYSLRVRKKESDFEFTEPEGDEDYERQSIEP
jgi:hypothetical protein